SASTAMPEASLIFDTASHEALGRLEKITAQLGDQRLYLAEQYARLKDARDSLHADRAAVMAEIDALHCQLEQRNRLVCVREESTAQKEEVLEQRAADLADMRRQLEAWRAQITADASAAEIEHARAATELRCRRRSADQQMAMLAVIRERWHGRRRSQVMRIR